MTPATQLPADRAKQLPRTRATHLEICTPERYLGNGRWSESVALGCCRPDEDPQDIADQFFPNEHAEASPGGSSGMVASIQVGDQDDEGCPRGVTIAEIWEVSP